MDTEVLQQIIKEHLTLRLAAAVAVTDPLRWRAASSCRPVTYRASSPHAADQLHAPRTPQTCTRCLGGAAGRWGTWTASTGALSGLVLILHNNNVNLFICLFIYLVMVWWQLPNVSLSFVVHICGVGMTEWMQQQAGCRQETRGWSCWLSASTAYSSGQNKLWQNGPSSRKRWTIAGKCRINPPQTLSHNKPRVFHWFSVEHRMSIVMV